MQKLYCKKSWQHSKAWDEPLPENLTSDWNYFKSQLHLLSSVSVPRFQRTPFNEHSYVAIFSDASEYALGVCAYVFQFDSNEKPALIFGKSRIAPTGATCSIARKELLAGILNSKISESIATETGIPNARHFHFTDSLTTIFWIKSDPLKWKVWVKNRVSKIQAATVVANWYHIHAPDNISDIRLPRLLFANFGQEYHLV